MARYMINELEDLEAVHEAICQTADFNGEEIEDYVAEYDYWYGIAMKFAYQFNENGEKMEYRTTKLGKQLWMTDFEYAMSYGNI